MTKQVDRIIYTSIKVTTADSLYGGQNFRGAAYQAFFEIDLLTRNACYASDEPIRDLSNYFLSKLKSAT